jgi:hypothetical protein
VADAGDGDRVLLHRFEQGALGLGRGAVDLIGEHDLSEDRPAVQLEAPARRRDLAHHEHVGAGDVARHEIGRELDARKAQIQTAREGAHEQRLA